MRRTAIFLPFVAALAACDGNPFETAPTVEEAPVEEMALTGEADATTQTDANTEQGITSDRVLPPGTASPSATSGLVRREADNNTGNGFAQSFVYDRSTDTFSVDNLAFDGDNTYNRDDQVGSLGPFAVYENNSPITDAFNGRSLAQFPHKAIYGVSTTGNTEFAIVRTGAYVGYGFGGFIYQRNGNVTFPTTGQAIYQGDYAALRDFQGTEGLEYVQGDMVMAIDFADFNAGAGVRGEVSNRTVFDENGADVTSTTVALYNGFNQSSITALPTLRFVIQPGVADVNGEIIGTASSFITNNAGARVQFETGNYYAVVSGENATEVVGVVVTESSLTTTVTARDTGGFILYR